MDTKYIENVGMTNIDEGMWNQLKAKASGIDQMRKNVFSRGSSDVKDVQFDSLFKNFLGKCVRTLEDFHTVISPKIDANKMTPAQEKKIANLFALRSLMKKIEKVPIKEANIFTRPFSAIGAQAWGNLDSIIATYQKLLRGYYTSFIEDAAKLNIVPKEYLARKIASAHPIAKSFFQKFNTAVGLKKPVDTTTPVNAPSMGTVTSTSPATSSTTTASTTPNVSTPASSASIPTPVTSTPVSSAIAPAPTPSTHSSVPTSSSSTPPPIAASTAAPVKPKENSPLIETQPPQKTFELAQKSIEKIVNDLNKGVHEMAQPDESDVEDVTMNMTDLIRKYIKRNATKAEYPFPKPPVEVVDNVTKEKSIWFLRYHYAKDIAGHQIDFYQEDLDAYNNVKKKDNHWQLLLKFSASDVIDRNSLELNGSFDVMKNISRSNPKLAEKIQEGEQSSGKRFTNTGLNQKVAEALRQVIRAESTEDPRGKRQQNIGKPEQERGEKPDDPIADTPQTAQAVSTKISPENQARFVHNPPQSPEKPKPDAEGKPAIPPDLKVKQSKVEQDWKKEQEQLKQRLSKSDPKVKPGKKGSPKPVAPVKKGNAEKTPPTKAEIDANRDRVLKNKEKSKTPTADSYEDQKKKLGIDVKKPKSDDDSEELNESISLNLRDLIYF